jgi:hypothetical protein
VPFRSVVVVLLSLLKADLSNYVCTQILFAFLTDVLWVLVTLVCNITIYGYFESWSCAMISFRESLILIVHAACMFSARLSSGHHKLVSEPTACRNPFQLLGRS